MISKISREDLEFMEDLYNPIALAESLFDDFDNPASFAEEAFAHIRLGQLPLLSYEYLLDYDPKLSEKENFKLREGAGNCWILGGRKFGKCESVDNLCLLSSGEYVTFGSLIGKFANVISLNTKTNKFEESLATFSDNGIRDCLKIVLKSGKELTITKNHPLLTDTGWVEAKDLKDNQFIATGRGYSIEGILDVDKNVAKLLGYLLGDGGCTHQISFTNINDELIKEYLELADYFECAVRKQDITYYVRNKKYQRSKINPIQELVLKYGINKLSKHKTIPDEVFIWRNKYIAILLNRLFACDGTINKSNNVVSLTSVSRQLIYQISSLLLRFSIHSSIKEKKVKLNGKEFTSWTVHICKDSQLFIDKIGIKSKEGRYDKDLKKNSYTTSDVIPKKLISDIYSTFKEKKEFELRKLKHPNNPTRQKCEEVNIKIDNNYLDGLTSSDIYWDTISSIEELKNINTVAVSVPKNNNYISNDIVSHNTLIVEIVDTLISFILLGAEHVGFTSLDALHIRGILEKVISGLENHPFLSMFKGRVTRSPNYRIQLKTGYLLESVNMNITGKNPGCFDSDTEILTNKGFKYFKDLNYSDKVLTCNPNNRKAFFDNIKHIHDYEYEGELLVFNSRTSCLKVTPNHNMMVIDNKKIKSQKAEDITAKQIYFPATYSFKGETNPIVLEGSVNSRKKREVYDRKDWAGFLAWYLSEGSITKSHRYRIQLPQKKGKGLDRLESLLTKLGIKFSNRFDKKHQIYRVDIYNKLIAEHLLKYCGKVKNKRVPDYLLSSDSTVAKAFIEEYLYGDGCIYLQDGKYEAKSIFTSLKLLADDLQVMAQNAGYKTHLRVNNQNTFINGRHYNIDMYLIQLCSSVNNVFKKELIAREEYKGRVYCVTVEPYHSIFVRRNGCVSWTYQSQFFQKHMNRFIIEEASFETEEVYSKRLDAVAENGCIIRAAGMTTFTKYSPCGRIFYDLSKKPWVMNLPQYINPKWDDKEKKKAVKDHGGENSISYRVFVKGEVVEEGISVFDMERVRKNYDDKRTITHLEVTKQTFHKFDSLLIVERPKNINQLYIAADIGESAPSELAIFGDIDNNYKYLYNITLYNLTDKEQLAIFEYLIEKLQANFVGLDTTEGTARAIFRGLEEKHTREPLVWCSFNEKIAVDFDKDEYGNVIFKGGQPQFREEFVSSWSVKRLKDLLYQNRMILPVDYKLDIQLNSVVAMQSGNRTVYSCVAEEDHLLAAFRVFSIMQWNMEFNLRKPMLTKKFSKAGV